MAEKYFNRDDMHRRLNDTICLWNGEPVYVSTMHGSAGDNVDIFRLTAHGPNGIGRVNHTDAGFVDRSLPLGYINYGETCSFISRVPFRRNIQPLAMRQLQSDPPIGTNFFLTKNFADTIRGAYPGYTSCLEHVTSGAKHGEAFARDAAVAIRPGIKQAGLYYKTRMIALWNLYTSRWDYLQGPEIMHFRKLVEKLGVHP